MLSDPRNVFFVRLYAVLCIGGGLWVACSAKSGTLHCDRTTGQCRLQQATLLQTQQETFPIQQLKGAAIETNPRTDRYGTVLENARVVLLPDRTPLLDLDGYDREPHKIARQVNNFVGNPQTSSLYVTQGKRWIWWLVGTGVSSMGVFLLRRSR